MATMKQILARVAGRQKAKPADLDRRMDRAPGRSTKQAIEEGNYYEIKEVGGARRTFSFPAAKSPAQTLAWAKRLARRGQFAPIRPGTLFEAFRITGGGIGSRWVELAGEVRA